jgi:hypothetical protein
MKSLASIFLVLFVVGKTTAQPSATVVAAARPLALGESIHLAIENSAQIKKNKIDRQILERRVKEA